MFKLKYVITICLLFLLSCISVYSLMFVKSYEINSILLFKTEKQLSSEVVDFTQKFSDLEYFDEITIKENNQLIAEKLAYAVYSDNTIYIDSNIFKTIPKSSANYVFLHEYIHFLNKKKKINYADYNLSLMKDSNTSVKLDLNEELVTDFIAYYFYQYYFHEEYTLQMCYLTKDNVKQIFENTELLAFLKQNYPFLKEYI